MLSVAGFSNPVQIQAEGILNRGGVFAALEFAAFTAKYADLLDWAEARLRLYEHRGDVLAEALQLLRPEQQTAARPSPGKSLLQRRGQQKSIAAAAAAATNPDDPRQLIMLAWQSIHDHDRRLSIAFNIAGNDPALREWVAMLARRDRIPLPRPVARMNPVRVQAAPVEERTEPVTVRLDPELGRLAVGLRQAAALRLWAVGRDLVRQGSGAGWVSRADLGKTLARMGVLLSARHLRRLLNDGVGRFWNLDGRRVYLYSPGKVSLHLSRLAREAGAYSLIETNLPGVRDVYIPVEGSLASWEAHLYAAWLSHRGNPTIARDTLWKLFGRDPDTLRRWEREQLGGIVTVRRNDVQCGEDQQTAWDQIPEHAYFYLAYTRGEGGHWQRQTRIRWRMANTYLVCAGFRQHPRKGQAAKVRRALRREMEDQPADIRRGGALRERLYFDEAEHLKSYRRRHGTNVLGRFLWRGENRHGHGIFERSECGEYQTNPNERAHPRAERQWGIAQRWSWWRIHRVG